MKIIRRIAVVLAAQNFRILTGQLAIKPSQKVGKPFSPVVRRPAPLFMTEISRLDGYTRRSRDLYTILLLYSRRKFPAVRCKAVNGLKTTMFIGRPIFYFHLSVSDKMLSEY